MKELSWFDPSTDWQEQEADPRFQLLTPDKRCLCRTCGHFFTSLKAFDHHRLDSECRQPLSRGMVLDSKGFWGVQIRGGHESPLKTR